MTAGQRWNHGLLTQRGDRCPLPALRRHGPGGYQRQPRCGCTHGCARCHYWRGFQSGHRHRGVVHGRHGEPFQRSGRVQRRHNRRRAAAAILAKRVSDNTKGGGVAPYTPGTNPGDYRFTLPFNTPNFNFFGTGGFADASMWGANCHTVCGDEHFTVPFSGSVRCEFQCGRSARIIFVMLQKLGWIRGGKLGAMSWQMRSVRYAKSTSWSLSSSSQPQTGSFRFPWRRDGLMPKGASCHHC